MKMTKEQRAEFNLRMDGIIKYMNDTPDLFCPHDKIIITTNSCEVVRGEAGYTTDKYIRD